jgi:diguanylate cyclase (GGDEF)-like protein
MRKTMMENKKLIKRLEELEAQAIVDKQKIQELEKVATVDSMTGVYNYRYCKKVISKEIYKCKRYGDKGRLFSIIVADINGLKLINDILGHVQGDSAIKEVAHVLEANIRENSTICRYGGDEFIVILPDTKSEVAKSIATRLIQKVGKGEYSISAGVSTYGEDGKTWEKLFSIADKRMYEVKNAS